MHQAGGNGKPASKTIKISKTQASCKDKPEKNNDLQINWNNKDVRANRSGSGSKAIVSHTDM